MIVRNQRRFLALAIVATLVVFAASGCSTKDPYALAIRGSDDVSSAVHSAIVLAGQYYSTGKFSDQQKLDVASLLNSITDANMSFRKGVVAAKASGVAGKAEYLALAQSFINALPSDPTAFRYYSADSQKLFNEVMGPVKVAVNAIATVVAGAKGAS